VLTLASKTRPEPAPIAIGGTVMLKSASNPAPPSVTVSSLMAPPAMVKLQLSPVPVPPVKSTSKN
jgi:hypothetical protein